MDKCNLKTALLTDLPVPRKSVTQSWRESPTRAKWLPSQNTQCLQTIAQTIGLVSPATSVKKTDKNSK